VVHPVIAVVDPVEMLVRIFGADMLRNGEFEMRATVQGTGLAASAFLPNLSVAGGSRRCRVPGCASIGAAICHHAFSSCQNFA
jgi:hypothetical protein